MASGLLDMPATFKKRPTIMHGDVAPIDRLMRPLQSFLAIEAVSGLVLVFCTITALVLANSPLAHAYESFWETEVGLSWGDKHFHLHLLHLINDGLMTVFFFVVGLEIKREFVMGELRDWRAASLPVAAALGGMLVPAGIYLLLQNGTEGQKGWGIPMATDIAFVVGVLALFGKRVPLGLKLFLLTLAIADDLGAIIVIAAFYSQGVNTMALAVAIFGVALVVLFQRLGIWLIPIYFAAAVLIWLGMYNSGIHPTIAGVLLGFLTPIVGRMLPTRPFEYAAAQITDMPMGLEAMDRAEIQHTLHRLDRLTNLSISPLGRLEHALHKWVAYLIMPVFALSNAMVHFNVESLGQPLAWSVAAGLIVGKPIGIVAFTLFTLAIGLGRLPKGVTPMVLVGGACLGGIGFTMSLFVSALAFEQGSELLSTAKLGVLIGSVASAAIGSTILAIYLPKASSIPDEHAEVAGHH